MVEQRLEHIN